MQTPALDRAVLVLARPETDLKSPNDGFQDHDTA